MTESRRHDLLALTILSLITTLLFFDVLAGTHNFYLRDLTRYYYPTKHAIREIVLAGEFPYWNPLFSAGQPIAANPEHEVFYPLTWLLLLPNYDLGYRLHILVHVYLGVLGMYALLRSMALGAPAAFIGAFAFGLGGTYMSYINLLPIMFCAAWIPLTCLYVRKFLLEPRLRWYALAAFFLGMQFLVGEPTTVMQTGFIIGMYALYRGWYAARDHELSWKHAIPEMLSRVAFIALISIGAFAVGAAQMLPAIDHVGDSIRSRGFDYSLVSAWSMPWAKFLELIFPNIMGHMSIDRVTWYWGGGLYPGMGSAFLFNIYPGLLVTTLAVAAFFVRPRGGRLMLILTAFSFLLALGDSTPLLRLLYDTGIAESIRYPEKFALIAMFAISVFGAQMLQRMMDGDEKLRRSALGFVTATALFSGVVAILGFTPYYKSAFQSALGLSATVASLMVELSHRGWVIAFIRSMALLAILWLLPRTRPMLWVTLTATFVVADLSPVIHQINPRMPARFFTTPPEIAKSFPADRSQYRLFHEADWYGRDKPAQRYFGTGASVYWVVRNGLFPMTPARLGFRTVMERDYDKTALLPTVDFTEAVWKVKASGREDWWRPLMAMSNAWFRSEYRDFDLEKKRVKGDMDVAKPIRFLAAARAPRYYFADQIVTIRDHRDFADKLSKESHSDRVAFMQRATFVPAAGIVEGVRETANTVTLDVKSEGAAFLVMSVTPHKYWRVTLDGKPVPAIVTNVGFQGIDVPHGRHRVGMRYRNDLVPVGATISIATTLLLLGAALVPAGRRAVRHG